MKTIREYPAKSGTAKVVYYDDCNIYRVIHTNKKHDIYWWTKDKVEAIKHAQFITRF